MPTVKTMPKSTQRAHFEPAWKGDSALGIKTVSRQALGPDKVRAIDCNFQWAWTDPTDHGSGGQAFALHWRSPVANNFRYILEKGRVRRMTPAELVRPINRWPAAKVARWRRTADARSARPVTYLAMAKYAVEHGVTICAELKSVEFGTSLLPARLLVQQARAAGHKPWFMALYRSMPYCREKCRAVRLAGGEFAVIFGRFQRYRKQFWDEVDSWPVDPTRVW